MHVTVWFVRLQKALMRRVSQASWLSIVLVLVLLYGAGAVLLPWLEAPDSGFRTVTDYTWWFIVTTTTVGYGDMAPATPGGRLIAVLIMVFGVGVLAVSVAKIADAVLRFGRKRMRGLSQLDEKNHLVIFGYNAGDTEELVEHLRTDPTFADLSIVLCSSTEEENPMPDHVAFVRGDLTSSDLLERACVAAATRILIHGRDDNETLVVTLAVRSVNTQAHIVAHLKKPDTVTHVHRIDPEIECVRPLTIPLTVQAIQDRGATAVVSSLVDSRVDDTIFRLLIPPGDGQWTFGALQHHFKREHRATLVAVGDDPESHSAINLNPSYASVVQAGQTLFYISIDRLDDDKIDWRKISS